MVTRYIIEHTATGVRILPVDIGGDGVLRSTPAVPDPDPEPEPTPEPPSDYLPITNSEITVGGRYSGLGGLWPQLHILSGDGLPVAVKNGEYGCIRTVPEGARVARSLQILDLNISPITITDWAVYLNGVHSTLMSGIVISGHRNYGMFLIGVDGLHVKNCVIDVHGDQGGNFRTYGLRNASFENCVFRTGSNTKHGFRLHGVVNNVVATNCWFFNRGLYLGTEVDDGGIRDDVKNCRFQYCKFIYCEHWNQMTTAHPRLNGGLQRAGPGMVLVDNEIWGSSEWAGFYGDKLIERSWDISRNRYDIGPAPTFEDAVREIGL